MMWEDHDGDKVKMKLLLWVAGMAWVVQAWAASHPSAVDMTDRMETLGSPLCTRYSDSFRKGSGFERRGPRMCFLQLPRLQMSA